MISECALAIALQRAELTDAAHEGGLLTPMSALGDVIIRRLEASGRFNISSEVVLGQGDETRKGR